MHPPPLILQGIHRIAKVYIFFPPQLPTRRIMSSPQNLRERKVSDDDCMHRIYVRTYLLWKYLLFYKAATPLLALRSGGPA